MVLKVFNNLKSLVGQSILIATSLVVNDFIQIALFKTKVESHYLSLYFLIPFIGVSLGLLHYNKYPAKVFVGDTYCYFAGMVFATVAIMGNFSKTLLLFMMVNNNSTIASNIQFCVFSASIV